MALVLGLDGKTAALQAGTGQAVSSAGTLYVGLLSALPANYDGVSLSTVTGNELNSASFYVPATGRTAIPGLGSITTDQNGAVIANTGADIVWTNNSGGTVVVGGFFITDTSNPANDGSGKIFWVGLPSTGSLSFDNGEAVTITAGDLTLKID